MAEIHFDQEVDPIVFFYAMRFVGLPYKWGGNNPVDGGFDCSGLALEILRSGGLWPHKNDTTAKGIYNHFSKPENGVAAVTMKFGALAFYGRSVSRISHIGYGLDGFRIIDAGGGGSKTHTLEDADRDDAYVRIRRFDYRRDLVAILHPTGPSFL